MKSKELVLKSNIRWNKVSEQYYEWKRNAKLADV